VLPYLATSGERAPSSIPLAAGQISGLRLTTNRDDLVRAVCEGLAYTARHCFAAAGRSGRIVVAGGGSKSSNWMQMFADVLEVPLELARNPEVGPGVRCWRAPRRAGEHLDVERGPRRRVCGARRREPRVYDAATSARWSCSSRRPLWHTRAALARPEPRGDLDPLPVDPERRADRRHRRYQDVVVVGGGVTGAGVAWTRRARAVGGAAGGR
jgi:xylulokinase/erythritol kinase